MIICPMKNKNGFDGDNLSYENQIIISLIMTKVKSDLCKQHTVQLIVVDINVISSEIMYIIHSRNTMKQGYVVRCDDVVRFNSIQFTNHFDTALPYRNSITGWEGAHSSLLIWESIKICRQNKTDEILI